MLKIHMCRAIKSTSGSPNFTKTWISYGAASERADKNPPISLNSFYHETILKKVENFPEC